MILRSHGVRPSRARVRALCDVGKQGASVHALARAAEHFGLRSLAVQLSMDRLQNAPTPFIAHWKQTHFVVVDRVTAERVEVRDPAHGVVRYRAEEFAAAWAVGTNGARAVGTALLLEPTPALRDADDDDSTSMQGAWRVVWVHARRHRAEYLRVALALALSTFGGFLLPFLTQAIVDVGIHYDDLSFVHLALLGQLALFAGRLTVEFLRSRILLHVGARVSIGIVSDYLYALLRLPLDFFATRGLGDVLQRIGDNERVERLLTQSLMLGLFSLVHLLVCALVLSVLSPGAALLFVGSSTLLGLWLLLFAARRRTLDFKRFNQLADSQGKLVQLVSGLPDLKLAAAERQKRWEWEGVQAKLFRSNLTALGLEQWQEIGTALLVEVKDLLATIVVAHAVIGGQMTLGQMLAVQYLLGQTSGPLRQLVQFARDAQEARLSLERLAEVHELPSEEPEPRAAAGDAASGDLVLRNVAYRYPGSHPEAWVFRDLSLTLAAGKVTAIVGASGSGKSTLLRLLLRFIEPSRGELWLGGTPLSQLPLEPWRRGCGAVLQDGYLFSDTIAQNVALGEAEIDRQALLEALESAGAREFVEALPLGWNSLVGPDGQSLSQGQKQRLLIARALYKKPPFLCFDEATSALDANNERRIQERLEQLYQGRTVLVIAHRLSTVKKADRIVVLEHGEIVEAGSHAELVARRGAYFTLVKNQLELGT